MTKRSFGFGGYLLMGKGWYDMQAQEVADTSEVQQTASVCSGWLHIDGPSAMQPIAPYLAIGAGVWLNVSAGESRFTIMERKLQ